MNNSRSAVALSRRGFLAVTGGAAAATLLAACSPTGSGGKPIKFWNMPWGNVKFAPLDKKITQAYKPAGSLPAAT